MMNTMIIINICLDANVGDSYLFKKYSDPFLILKQQVLKTYPCEYFQSSYVYSITSKLIHSVYLVTLVATNKI